MPRLSNDLLREKSMKDFLAAMGIDISGVEITSVEGLFNFTFTDSSQTERFAQQLNDVIQADGESKTVKTISLAEIVEHEITEATCDDAANLATHRASCKAILDVIKISGANYTFSQDLEVLEVDLPAPAYAAMLNLLKYAHLTIRPDGKLIFDIKKYLKEVPENVIKIEGFNAQQLPLVLLNAGALEAKQMFYASKPLADGSYEVTPYFFVPQAATPPTYHFVLDVSTSMGKSLEDLKKSVKALAQQLFSFQPNAELSITTFSGGIHPVGTYKAGQLTDLNRRIDLLTVRGDTPLYEVTAHFINKITSTNTQNNVLLFTDGEESGASRPGSEFDITQKLASLGLDPSIIRSRNKFYIFSYHASQTQLMHRVADVFMSDVVNTTSADFVAAQQDPELMKKWAAARDLFSVRLLVSDKQGVQTPSEYQATLDMSGQLAGLKTRICQPGDKVDISITDGSGREVIHSTKSISLPTPVVAAVAQTASSDAATIARIGMMAAPTVAASAAPKPQAQTWGDWFHTKFW